MPLRTLFHTRGLAWLRSWWYLKRFGGGDVLSLDPQHRLRQRGVLGQQGERAAARYLRKKGYRIIQQRLRSPLGEIDIIAVDERTVVFVEVKTRRSAAWGRPAQSLHATQQARLTRSALAFLKSHGLLQTASRFDVVEVLWPREQRHPDIHHFPNAFPAVGRGQFYR